MTDPLLIFIAGFISCSVLIALYLLNRLIDVLSEMVSILRDELKNE